MQLALAPDQHVAIVTVTATAAAQRVQLRLLDLEAATRDLTDAVLRLVEGLELASFAWQDVAGRYDWTLERGGRRVHVHITAAGRAGRGASPARWSPLNGELLQADVRLSAFVLQLLALIDDVEHRLALPGKLLTPSQRDLLVSQSEA